MRGGRGAEQLPYPAAAIDGVAAEMGRSSNRARARACRQVQSASIPSSACIRCAIPSSRPRWCNFSPGMTARRCAQWRRWTRPARTPCGATWNGDGAITSRRATAAPMSRPNTWKSKQSAPELARPQLQPILLGNNNRRAQCFFHSFSPFLFTALPHPFRRRHGNRRISSNRRHQGRVRR